MFLLHHLEYLASKANVRNKVKMAKCTNIWYKYQWHECVSARWDIEHKNDQWKSLWSTIKQFHVVTLIAAMPGFCSLVSGARSTGSSCKTRKPETENYNLSLTMTRTFRKKESKCNHDSTQRSSKQVMHLHVKFKHTNSWQLKFQNCPIS
jgi:hypothetical protein